MKITRATALWVLTFAGAAALAGCANTGLSAVQSGMLGAPAPSAYQRQTIETLRGMSLQTIAQARSSSSLERVGKLKELAVVWNDKPVAIDVLNANFKQVMSIRDDNAQTDWIDSNGDFYATNCCVPGSVSEFDKTGKLIYTYSKDITYYANDVTTDTKENVVVASGYVASAPGNTVLEFPQGSDKPSVNCRISGLGVPYAVAFDKSGNLFVTLSIRGASEIQEYKGGLRGCSATTLPVTLSDVYPGGLKVDNVGNLVVSEYSSGVAIIPPPYKSISKVITNKGQTNYTAVALDEQSKALFTAGLNDNKVFVNAYPSGKLETTLGKLRSASGVATYPFQN